MNFCKFYNKTRIYVDDNLIDWTVSDGETYNPVSEINILFGTISLLLILISLIITGIMVTPIYSIWYVFNYLYKRTTSKCDLK